MTSTRTAQDLANDFRVMIEADTEHLIKAVRFGDRVLAHQFVDSIIDAKRALEDLEAAQPQRATEARRGPECTCTQSSDTGHDSECPRAAFARGATS